MVWVFDQVNNIVSYLLSLKINYQFWNCSLHYHVMYRFFCLKLSHCILYSAGLCSFWCHTGKTRIFTTLWWVYTTTRSISANTCPRKYVFSSSKQRCPCLQTVQGNVAAWISGKCIKKLDLTQRFCTFQQTFIISNL